MTNILIEIRLHIIIIDIGITSSIEEKSMLTRYPFRGLRAALVLSALSIVAIGCGNEEVVDPDDERAKVLFVHAAPELGPINVTIDDSAFANNRVFGNMSTYLDVGIGPAPITFLPAGGGAAHGSVTYTFAVDKNYTLFALNDTTGEAHGLVFMDDLTPPSAGKALIRGAHLINDAPKLRMSFKGTRMEPIYDSIAFAEVTEFFSKEVDPIMYTVRYASGPGDGTTGANSTTVLEQSVTLEAGKIYTLAATGTMAAPTLTVIKHN